MRICDLDHPSLVLPPIAGAFRLLISRELHRATREYVVRHELGHVITGDADEPAVMHFTGHLPECEDVADLFAFLDLITREECDEGPEYVAERMRELVVLDYAPWYLRLERLPVRLIRMRKLVDEWLD